MKRAPFALGSLVGFAVAWAGCSQQATTVAVRSLERSGKAAFLCLRDQSASPGQELDGCLPTGVVRPNDYSSPHVVALVTQTARGEVAVIDISAQTVLDTNAAVPGFNFFPVGALPTDIAATPGSNAAFVAIGDPLRPGIFAIPSSRLPFQALAQPSTLASWPACSLGEDVATELVVVPDYTGMRPGRCDASLPVATPTPGYDLSSEAPVFGRLKIVAMLPDSGEIVVIDAQELLARTPGTFDPCPIEKRLALQAVLPGTPVADAGPSGTPADASAPDGATTMEGGTDAGTEGGGAVAEAGASVDASTCMGRIAPSVPASLQPHPAALALSDDGRLFVSDDRASVIHVVDVSDPCAISEKAPLLPFSLGDPTRAVVTSAIAVSPLTSDKKRFVYAVDARGGGNVMAFDVTSDASDRRPIVLRPDVVFNPFEPRDRINFGSPVQDLTFAEHEVVVGDPTLTGGVVPRGIKCNPELTDAQTTDPAFPYRFVGFDPLAGPRRLRGTFGFAALSSGRIGVVDVDDLDAPCRRPATSNDPALGCTVTLTRMPSASMPLQSASGEASCQVVERHQPRSAQYFANAPNVGLHAPAMQSFPLLYDDQGTVLSNDRTRADSVTHPRLLGPSLVAKDAPTRAVLASVIGSDSVPEDVSNDLSSDPAKAKRNWVAFDLREPRAHFGQEWQVTFEGIIPPLTGREGRLRCAAADKKPCEGGENPSNFVLVDPSIGFCDQGAQGAALSQSLGLPAGDIVQIVEPLPDPADPYWGTVAAICSPTSCQSAYGPPDVPTAGRDLEVDVSFQDHLVLKPNPNRGPGAPLECCFPYPTSYNVRVGKQWLVTGAATGYAHHIIPDPTAADPSAVRCINSCDPSLRLRNSRAVEVPVPDPMSSDPAKIPSFDDADKGPGAPSDPRIFRNAQIRFVLWKAEKCTVDPCVTRGSKFSFVESGGFASIEIQLSTVPVLPQSIRFVRGISQLAIPDAVSQGLLLFDLNVMSSNGVKAFF